MVGEDGQLSDAEFADLAAFADGLLAPAKRARIAAVVEHSPELQRLVAEQRAAVEAVRGVDVAAPPRLRARIEAELDPPQRRRRWGGLALAGSLAGALGVVALVAVLVVSGSESSPTPVAVAALAERGADSPAPAADPAQPNLLAASVGGVPFPDFAKLGYRADGERADELEGRDVQTVFYAHEGEQVAYSIVSGEALAWPGDATRRTRDGVELGSFERDGEAVVVWTRDGRTCVVSAEGASERELLELAAWDPEAAAAT
jgi:anti-sigma factor RsiW